MHPHLWGVGLSIGNYVLGLHVAYRSTYPRADLANGGMGQPETRNAHHQKQASKKNSEKKFRREAGSLSIPIKGGGWGNDTRAGDVLTIICFVCRWNHQPRN